MEILSLLNIIISAQAFFLSIHFMLKPKGVRTLNLLLAFLCFSFAFISLNTYLNLSGILSGSNFIQDVSNNLMWYIGPSLYLYVLYNDKIPNKKFLLYNYVPFLIPTIIDIFFNWELFSQIIPFVAFIQISIYLFLALRYAITHYAKAKQYYNWILPAIIAFTIVLAANFSLSVLILNGIQVISHDLLQSFTSLFAFPIFYLAYKEMNSSGDLGIIPRKYQSTNISEKKSNEILNKIEKAMREDKIYLQKKVTLQIMSEHISIPPKYISQTINKDLNMSFSDYVLTYRLEDVKQRLIDPSNKNLTIFGVAQESGFNSNSRFSFLFKKHTGLTPKEFQKKYLA